MKGTLMCTIISEEGKNLLKLNEGIERLDNEILALYQQIGRLTQERFVLTAALKEQSNIIKMVVNCNEYNKHGFFERNFRT